jgi:hypothetical protein
LRHLRRIARLHRQHVTTTLRLRYNDEFPLSRKTQHVGR